MPAAPDGATGAGPEPPPPRASARITSVLALYVLFWLCAALILWTQLGYALALAALVRVRALAPPAPRGGGLLRSSKTGAPDPSVTLIVAAHDEQDVIAAKVADALALDYARERLQLIVACDGCTDATAERARAAGADLVLELPRAGKIRAQDRAVERASGELIAFSDANSHWEPDALRELLGAFADPRVGYACGQVRFVQGAVGARASNQEGVYWRYELAVRALESRLYSITAGNGAIYATRRDTYIVVDPIMGHDLSLPFNIVKRGLRAVYVPSARASEKMVPSLLGEFARKRRMMSHTWPIVLRGGMLSPRGYPPLYALMIFPTACSATPLPACTRSRSPPTSRSSRPAPARCTSSRSRCSSRCCSPRCSPARCACDRC